jgi:uncharacterized membrane protein YhaH (DUF805 family)
VTESPWRTWTSFQGRLARFNFWWNSVALWAVFIVLFVFLDRSLGRGATLLLYPPFFWMAAILIVRRFHDRGQSAWWFWLALIPVFGPLWVIVTLGFRVGTIGDNHYGDDPRLVDVDYLTVN